MGCVRYGPKDNEKDLADIPPDTLSSLTVHLVESPRTKCCR